MNEILFAGTAVTRDGAVGSLYRLTHGAAWEKVDDIPGDAAVQAIVQHPKFDAIVFAASRKGIYKSDDKGVHWRRIPGLDPSIKFWSIEVDPRDPHDLFAGTAPIGVFESRDTGETWTPCEVKHPERFTIPFGASRVMRLAFHPTDAIFRRSPSAGAWSRSAEMERFKTVLGKHAERDRERAQPEVLPGMALDFIEIKRMPDAYRDMARSQPYDICEMAPTMYLMELERGAQITALPLPMTRRFRHAGIKKRRGLALSACSWHLLLGLRFESQNV